MQLEKNTSIQYKKIHTILKKNGCDDAKSFRFYVINSRNTSNVNIIKAKKYIKTVSKKAFGFARQSFTPSK
jgi:hypothetical protein